MIIINKKRLSELNGGRKTSYIVRRMQLVKMESSKEWNFFRKGRNVLSYQ